MRGWMFLPNAEMQTIQSRIKVGTPERKNERRSKDETESYNSIHRHKLLFPHGQSRSSRRKTGRLSK